MDRSIDKYILDLRSKLNENFFSPSFIRLANLLYINKNYDECITVCKTGLEIYPNYLTAKLILLKAFIKAEYLTEAENLYKELRYKINNKALLSKIRGNLKNLKDSTKQEKIYYPDSLKLRHDFKSFEKKFGHKSKAEFDPENILEINELSLPENESFMEVKNKFESIKLHSNSFDPKSIISSRKAETSTGKKSQSAQRSESVNEEKEASKNNKSPADDTELGKMKIITETLADILAGQGNYQDAFEAYNFLLRAGVPSKQRIEEKIHELERNMSKEDN